jgi:O-methyltransferase involved in polyketide biosynthesis
MPIQSATPAAAMHHAAPGSRRGSQQPVTSPEHTATPNIARMYSFWLGGRDYLTADWPAAAAVLTDFPVVGQLARSSRYFTGRAVRHVAAAGIDQFIDIGAGLPGTSAVLPTVRYLRPDARVAYIDNDPVVLSHARAVTAVPGTEVIEGDLRDPAGIATNSSLHELIDFTEPACLILTSVLHFLNPQEADTAVAALTGLLAPGSYLILSAGTSTGTGSAVTDRLRTAYQGSTPVTSRAADEIQAWFAGLDLVAPGVTDLHAWRPDSLWYWPATDQARMIGGVARKPGVQAATRRRRVGCLAQPGRRQVGTQS